MVAEAALYRPDWDLPPGVFAFVTTRQGGCSTGAYESFNLGKHVGDAAAAVQQNRDQLLALLGKATGCDSVQIQWLQQVHGTTVLQLATAAIQPPPRADAIHSTVPGLAVTVMTADCLPVLFCSRNGAEIAVAHAGWRGLLGGVLENTVRSFKAHPSAILAWLGPAIGSCHFEVGGEVRVAFLAAAGPGSSTEIEACFRPGDLPGKWMADLYALARLRLRAAGLADISGQTDCTVCHADNWYSHRRSQPTGRFATLIVKS